MRKRLLCLLLGCLFLSGSVRLMAQDTLSRSYAVKASGYLLFNGGWAVSIGVGYWQRYRGVQPATNLSLNILANKRHLGNRDVKFNRFQINVVVSPLLTVNLSKWDQDLHNRRTGLEEEINPFYLSNTGAVYSNYRSQTTIGTSIMVMPKGLDKNVVTARNRAQQLIFIQFKKGFDPTHSLELNFYNDYLLFTDTGVLQGLADNRDRFFTGGINVQARLGKELKVKAYNEVYTGSSYVDRFDYPDLLDDFDTLSYRTKEPRIVRKRYAYQDPGQGLFNRGRTVLVIDYTPTTAQTGFFGSHARALNYNRNTLQAYVGIQEGKQMYLQDFIHRLIKINKIKAGESPEKFNTKSSLRDHYRFFKPNNPKWRLLFGAGSTVTIH